VQLIKNPHELGLPWRRRLLESSPGRFDAKTSNPALIRLRSRSFCGAGPGTARGAQGEGLAGAGVR